MHLTSPPKMSERLRYFWRKQRPNTLLSGLKCCLRFQATRRRRHCQCILQQTSSLKILVDAGHRGPVRLETEYVVKWSEMLPLFSSHTQKETLPMYITTNSKSQDLVSTSNINNHNQAALNSAVFPISWQQLQNTEYLVLGDRATMLSTPLSDPDFHRTAAVLDQI